MSCYPSLPYSIHCPSAKLLAAVVLSENYKRTITFPETPVQLFEDLAMMHGR